MARLNIPQDSVAPGPLPRDLDRDGNAYCTRHEQRPQPRQRPLTKLPHVDSMLLPFVQKSPFLALPQPSSQLRKNTSPIRATPGRVAKAGVKYSSLPFSEKSSDEGDEIAAEDPGSDWFAEEELDLEEDSEDDCVERDGAASETSPTWRNRMLFKDRTQGQGRQSEALGLILNATERDKACVNILSDVKFKHNNMLLGPEPSSPDPAATIKFSPPRLRSPFKKPLLPSAPQQPRPSTPPASPSKSILVSPRKLQRVLFTPSRPSIDASWDQAAVDTFHDQFSPRKLLVSPRKIPLPGSGSDSDGEYDQDRDPALLLGSPTKLSRLKINPGKNKDRAAILARKAFQQERHIIAERFLHEVDEKIAQNEVGRLAADTGGVQLIWSRKLNSTAGRANWRREAVKTKNEEGVVTIIHRHRASIELAEKVIDNEHRLFNVLAHEYCHLANFMISGVRDQPHGASFKRWAARVTDAFAHCGVEVTTKHSYDISYKYAWSCSEVERCGMQYQRHSKSIDPIRQACGKCKGRLVQIRPVPRGAAVVALIQTGEGAGGTSADQRNIGVAASKTEYQKFVKENFGRVREDLGAKSPMKDVMRELGARYRSSKETCPGAGTAGITAQPNGEDASLESSLPVIATAEVVDLVSADDEVDEDLGGNKDHANAGKDGSVDKVSRVLDFLKIHDE